MSTAIAPHKQQGLQTAAILLLCRFVFFVCAEIPFTSAYAIGTLLGVGVQFLLCLPLVWKRNADAFSRSLLLIYRLLAVYAAGTILSAIYGLLQELQAAHPTITLLLLLAAACYALTLPRRATGRVSVILLFFLCAGIGTVIVAALMKGEPLLLYTPSPPYGIWTSALAGFSQNLPLAFLPLCVLPYASSPRQCRPWILEYLGGQLVLVLTIASGALCGGRLAQWRGNAFFLLLAQLQQDTAIRMDGFWIGVLMLSAVTALTFFMQIFTTAAPERTLKTGGALAIGCLFLVAGILFIMYSEFEGLTNLLILLGTGLLPLLRIFNPKHRHPERSRT